MNCTCVDAYADFLLARFFTGVRKIYSNFTYIGKNINLTSIEGKNENLVSLTTRGRLFYF